MYQNMIGPDVLLLSVRQQVSSTFCFAICYGIGLVLMVQNGQHLLGLYSR